MANNAAARFEIRPLTNGRFLVLVILASVDGSYSIFRVFALAEHSAVPVVKKKSVNGLRLGVSVIVGISISGTGYSAYGAMADKVTRTVRRGFERDRKVENVRRKESLGCAAAADVRSDDASGGRGASDEVA